jgi:hypothetical protein
MQLRQMATPFSRTASTSPRLIPRMKQNRKKARRIYVVVVDILVTENISLRGTWKAEGAMKNRNSG